MQPLDRQRPRRAWGATLRDAPVARSLALVGVLGCAGAPAAEERFATGWTGDAALASAARPEATATASSGPAGATSALRAPAGDPREAARAVRSASAQSVAVPSASSSAGLTLGSLQPAAPPGCACQVDRDRIAVTLPCGSTTCVDDDRVRCEVGAAGPVLREDGGCGETDCTCLVELPDDTAVALGCGVRACIEGGLYACGGDGALTRGGGC